ncbi:MAG: YqgE/AlgH family protein [Gammaproteobacteria bacterium]
MNVKISDNPLFEIPPGSLSNQFLIAMPHLDDPWFNHTVTYLWRHNEEGALGIVVNKPSKLLLSKLFAELKIDCSNRIGDIDFHKQYVMTGGPVEESKGFILHSSEKEWEYTIPITTDLSISMSKDILVDIAKGDGPEQYLVALGCAGWDAGQLDEEITNNVWLTVPATPELIFSSEYEKKAEACAATLGVTLQQLSSFAGHS